MRNQAVLQSSNEWNLRVGRNPDSRKGAEYDRCKFEMSLDLDSLDAEPSLLELITTEVRPRILSSAEALAGSTMRLGLLCGLDGRFRIRGAARRSATVSLSM